MQQLPTSPLGSEVPAENLSPAGFPSITATENLNIQGADPITGARKTSVAPRGFNLRSCNTCRRRKVKCDKVEGGCGNCARSHTECVYPGPGRAPRRPKSGTVKCTTERETELLKRLRRLEGVVEELSGQVESETAKSTLGAQKRAKGGDSEGEQGNKSHGVPVRVVGMDEGPVTARQQWAGRMVRLGGGPPKYDVLENEFGKLVIDEGKSRYISNSFWARFVLESLSHRSNNPDDLQVQ